MVKELNEKEMNMEKVRREFEGFIKANIIDALPERYASQEPRIETIQKNNKETKGVIVTLPGSNIAPTIYLESFFDMYMDGEATLDEILQQIAEMIVKNEIPEAFDIETTLAWEVAKDKVVPRLYNADNKKLLENTVSRKFLDMVITYAVELHEFYGSLGSIKVTKTLLHMWNITEDDLYAQAMKNLKAQGHIIKSISDTVRELTGGELPFSMPDTKKLMYVATNRQGINGANILLNSSLLKEAVGKVGEDYFILPSSIHEILFVRAGIQHNEVSLKRMVMEVNATALDPQDKLTDSVYRYVNGKVIKVA